MVAQLLGLGYLKTLCNRDMIPSDIKEWIFPEIADGAADAAVLRHECGIDFQFNVESLGDTPFVITNKHLKSWRTKLPMIAAQAGHNCFSYNTLEADPEGVYYHDDGNTLAMLFAPATFLEHNHVDGYPILLLIDDCACVLTGSRSSAGAKLIKKHRKKAIAKSLVTIDNKWQQWIAYLDPV